MLEPDWAEELVENIQSINRARAHCIATASSVAGCDLSDWEFEDIIAYIDLGVATYGHQMGYWDWQKTAR